MLGEKIAEGKGRIAGNRVVRNDQGEVVVETSFQSMGKLLGLETTELGSYTARMRPGGTLSGEGQGMVMTKDGESAVWKAVGVGKPTGKGLAVSWRASVVYETTSTKLARLNGVIAVAEFEADENGNTSAGVWEWK